LATLNQLETIKEKTISTLICSVVIISHIALIIFYYHVSTIVRVDLHNL